MNINYDIFRQEYLFYEDNNTKLTKIKNSKGNAKLVWQKMNFEEKGNFSAKWLDIYGKAISTTILLLTGNIFHFLRFQKNFIFTINDSFYPYIRDFADDEDIRNFEVFVESKLIHLVSMLGQTSFSDETLKFYEALLEKAKIKISFLENYLTFEVIFLDNFIIEKYNEIFDYYFGEIPEAHLQEYIEELKKKMLSKSFWQPLYALLRGQIIQEARKNFFEHFDVVPIERDVNLDETDLINNFMKFFDGNYEIEDEDKFFDEKEEVNLDPIWGNFIETIIDDE